MSDLPMTARGWATEIMVELRKCGANIPLVTLDGFTVQDQLTGIMERAMAQAARGEEYRDVVRALEPKP